MMYYSDMTFCPFYRECRDGEQCPRKLDKKVRDDAKKWAQSDEAPIAQYTDKPWCFREKRYE